MALFLFPRRISMTTIGMFVSAFAVSLCILSYQLNNIASTRSVCGINDVTCRAYHGTRRQLWKSRAGNGMSHHIRRSREKQLRDDCHLTPAQKQPLKGSAIYVSVQWLRSCLASIPVAASVRNSTIAALETGIKFSADRKCLSLFSSSSADKKCLNMDLANLVSTLRTKSFQHLLEFQQDVTRVVHELKDPHVRYRPPFSLLVSVCVPLEFGSRILGDLPGSAHQEVYISQLVPLQGQKFLHFAPFVGSKVQSVNGLPPLQFFAVVLSGCGVCVVLCNYFPKPYGTFPDLSVVSLPHTNSFLLEVEGQRLEVPFLFRIPDTSNHNLRCLFGDSITSRVPGKSTSGRPCPISITQCSTLSAKSDEAASGHLPVVHFSEPGRIDMTLPSFLVSPNEALRSLRTSFARYRHLRTPRNTLTIDVSGNAGGYISTMTSVLLSIVKTFSELAEPLSSWTLCPLVAFETVQRQAIATRLLKLMKDLPSEVCLPCMSSLLDKLESYARLAGLPDVLLEKILHEKRNMFNYTLSRDPVENARRLKKVLLHAFKAQSKHFLSLSGLEDQGCLVKPAADSLFDNSSSSLAAPLARVGVCIATVSACEELVATNAGALLSHSESTTSDFLGKLRTVKDIVVLSDGRCASSCAQFVYILRNLPTLLSHFPRVKLVTYGGVRGHPMPAAYAGNVLAYDHRMYAAALGALDGVIRVLEEPDWWQSTSVGTGSRHNIRPVHTTCPSKFAYSYGSVLPPQGLWDSLHRSDLKHEFASVEPRDTDQHFYIWPKPYHRSPDTSTGPNSSLQDMLSPLFT